MEGADVTAICKRCGQEFEYRVPTNKGMWANFLRRDYCYPCVGIIDSEEKQREEEKHQARLAYDRVHMFATCGVPWKYQQPTEDLAGFDWTGNEKQKAKFYKYLQDFPGGSSPVGYPSLMLVSQHYGVGKTRLACALMRELINAWKEDARDVSPYRFWGMPDVIVAIQQGQRFGSEKSSQDVYQELASARLLILDDVGKEAKRDSADIYYKIINDRYNSQLPIVLTANLHPSKAWKVGGLTLEDVMGNASVSRLKEMCKGFILEIKGEDRR